MLNNFSIVSLSQESGDVGPIFRGLGWARGKYTEKVVATEIVVYPQMDGTPTKFLIRLLGDDDAMLGPAQEELSTQLKTWVCPSCGAKLDQETVRIIRKCIESICEYCKTSLSLEI